jgi:hypothetical protein
LNNLNAFNTGDYTQPFSRAHIAQLAQDITKQPDWLPQILSQTIHSLHHVHVDPLKTLPLLKPLLDQLPAHAADYTFTAELEIYVSRLPSTKRTDFQTIIWKYALTMTSINKVIIFRTLVKALEKRRRTGTTIGGIDATTS